LAPVVPAQWLNNNQIKIKLFFYQKEHYGLIQSMYRGYGFAIKSIDADTVLMTKVINGVKIMVEATTNTDIDIINKTIDDESYAMVGHRGHSYQLPETFSPFEDHRNKQKLLYIGSCGGFRSIPQLMHYYFGNYFIATESVGVGAVNNEVAYHLVAALALNKTKVLANQYHFQDILSYILKKMPNFEKTGLVMPHHKALLLYDFLEKIKNTNGQTAAD
jgi:hypothetical protein